MKKEQPLNEPCTHTVGFVVFISTNILKHRTDKECISVILLSHVEM